MKTILLSIGQLTLVAIVYYCAYKKGYEAALEKTMGLIEEVSGPVHDLFEKLNQSAEEKAINK